MRAENGNAAAVSKQFDCNGERFEGKAAREQLLAMVAHRSPMRDKKMAAGAARIFPGRAKHLFETIIAICARAPA